jgi:hypothetical protein
MNVDLHRLRRIGRESHGARSRFLVASADEIARLREERLSLRFLLHRLIRLYHSVLDDGRDAFTSHADAEACLVILVNDAKKALGEEE